MLQVAMSSAQRFPLQNDIPTYGELKLGDTLPTNGFSVWGPKGIDPKIAQKLAEALHSATQDPSLINLLQDKNAILINFKDGPTILAEVKQVDTEWGERLKTIAP
jgi:tripartite-type tricarboxylate transporter receptor subunit TctC